MSAHLAVSPAGRTLYSRLILQVILYHLRMSINIQVAGGNKASPSPPWLTGSRDDRVTAVGVSSIG